MRSLSLLVAGLLMIAGCSSSSSGPPGGDAGADVLEDAGLLDDDAIALGPSTPDDADVQTAICDYAFGTASDVADEVGLDGDVTLDEEGGYQQLGGGGSGLRCFYNVNDEPAFGITIWSSPLEIDDATTITELELPSGRFGWAGFHPSYDGEPMEEEAAEEWLTEADGRFAGASV